MLKLPRLEISQSDYSAHVDALLRDDSCIIFLDTNILAKMFALYKGARDEFAAWVEATKEKNRIKIPAWCIQEYSNRVVRHKLQDYTSNYGTSLGTTLKILPQLIDQLSTSMNDTAAVQKGFTNRQAYLDKVFDAQEELLELLRNVNLPKRNADSPAAIHKEVIRLFEDIVLPSDIFALMQGCYEDYAMRYANKVPPGFQDEKQKDRNQIGDYIIWRELLQAVKDSINIQTGEPAIKKILYVSNDLKNDWVYRPSHVINARNISVGNPEEGGIYLIDPRLEYEINLAAGQEIDIVLISFTQLASALSRWQRGSFTLLASAVQALDAAEPAAESIAHTNATGSEGAAGSEDAAANNSADSEDSEVTRVDTETTIPNASPDVTIQVDEPSNAEPNITSATEPNTILVETDIDIIDSSLELVTQLVPYSSTALADSNYSIPNNPIGYIIADLKSHTWDIQTKAINKISSYIINTSTPDELFVLGRNILQTAEGDSFSAKYFIERFPHNLAGSLPQSICHLFNGMMYEIYFDSERQFRGAKGKTTYLNLLYKIYRNNPLLKDCEPFLQAVLKPHDNDVLHIPDVNDINHTITLDFIQSIYPEFEFKLTKCLIDGNLITREIDDFGSEDTHHLLRLRSHDTTVEEVVAAIADSRYIPNGFYTGTYTLNGSPMSPPTPSDFIVRGLYA
jgi:hypothetical protein